MDTTIKLSLVYSVWNPRANTIETHLDEWFNYSEETRKSIEIILVDDCSDQPICVNPNFNINLKVARITDNIYWNICGAKNLGFHLASSPFVFSSDQDHLFYSEKDLIRAMNFPKERYCVYFFKRVLPDGTSRKKDHPNTFMIHKNDFELIGGYDEDFSGHRGFSDHMIHQQFKKFGFKQQTVPIRIKEYKEFTCIDPGNRNFSYNAHLVNKKMNELNKGIYKVDKSVRFNWKIIKELKYND